MTNLAIQITYRAPRALVCLTGQERPQWIGPSAPGKNPPRTTEQFGWPPIDCAGRGQRSNPMRSIILWLIGIPIPIILLIALCTHHF
jgi:hypothetical protein